MRISSVIILLCFAPPSFAASYRQVVGSDGNASKTIIQRIDDSAFIPVSTDNRDYQEFLKWQKAGNTIAPALTPVVQVDPKADDKAIIRNTSTAMTTRFNALLRVLDLDK